MSAKTSEIFQPISAEEDKRRKQERARMNHEQKFGASINSLPEEAGKNEIDSALKKPLLYYPGAGKDFKPLIRFVQDETVDTVVYTDYLSKIVREVMKDCIHNISDEYEVSSVKRIEPEALGKNSWDEFWPENPAVRQNRNPADACGFFSEILFKPQEKKISFIYLATEGIQTYKILFSEKMVNPKVLVISFPGMVGAWDDFRGMESKLYEVAKEAFPEIIYTDKQRAWPGYERVSDFGEPEGANNSRRAIYKMGGNKK